MEDPEEVLERLGRRIAELRKRAALTQADVAKQLDTALNNYQRIEHGNQNATVRTLVKIAGVLEVPLAALFEAPTALTTGRPARGGSAKRSR